MWSFEVTSHWLDIRRCVPEYNVKKYNNNSNNNNNNNNNNSGGYVQVEMHAVGKEVVVLLGIANSPCTEGLIINSKWLRYEILKK